MGQFTDITYRPIYRHVLDNRYRYIGFADMAFIGRYWISADTDMPTLLKINWDLGLGTPIKTLFHSKDIQQQIKKLSEISSFFGEEKKTYKRVQSY